MAEISFLIHDYQEKLKILNTDIEGIEAVPVLGIDTGTNVSDTIQAYYDMYNDISMIIKYYKWTLQHTVTNLTNAGEAIIKADQNISSQFLTGGM